MKKIQSVIAFTVALAGLLAFYGSQAQAAPFTDHFDALIADLQSRATTLSNSTDKVQQKQFKTIQKVIATLEGKTSTSVATDIKNLGKIAKTLAKSFPNDFAPTPGPFSTDLETALQGLIDDVQTDIDTTQTTLDGLGASSCAAKAQTTLDAASNLVAQASSATDFATAAKLLGSGLKSAQKAAAAANKCSSGSTGGGGGGGGGGGDFMKATISGDFSLNFLASAPTAPPVAIIETGNFSIVTLYISGGDPSFHGSEVGITFGVDPSSVTGPGTYPIGGDVVRLDTGIFYYIDSGTVTFTAFDLANQKLTGTFSFTAGSGTVTVSNGSFSISKIN